MSRPAIGARAGLAYGFMGLPLAFCALPVYVQLPAHYASEFGVPLASLGVLLLVARALDALVDPAIGQAAGNALNWQYTLSLPVDGKVWEVQFDDWMFLVDEHVMLNRARMSKFGFTLGEVTISFRRP